MRFNKKMPLEVSVHLRYLHQDKGIKVCELVKKKEFSQYSKSNIYIHAKLPVHNIITDQRSKNKGRPRLLSDRDNRKLIRAVGTLRNNEGSFSARRLKLEADIDLNVSDHTVRLSLNRHGYKYLQTRRKGLMSQKDLKTRLAFARKVKRLLPPNFWTSGISLYLDGTSFVHKNNPCDQAKSRKSMAWRKRSEGLSFKCTSKGKRLAPEGECPILLLPLPTEKA